MQRFLQAYVYFLVSLIMTEHNMPAPSSLHANPVNCIFSYFMQLFVAHPGSMRSLQDLRLNENVNLNNLPCEISFCPKLKVLFLENCPLADFPQPVVQGGSAMIIFVGHICVCICVCPFILVICSHCFSLC